jgi:hypothetical protein
VDAAFGEPKEALERTWKRKGERKGKQDEAAAAKRTPCPCQQSIGRRLGDFELSCELTVGEAAQLREQQCLLLLRRQPRQTVHERRQLGVQDRPLGRIELCSGRCRMHCLLTSAPVMASPALPARDRTEPGLRLPRARARKHALVGKEKCLLGGVLSVLLVAQQLSAQPLDERAMGLDELGEQRVELGFVAQANRQARTIGVGRHYTLYRPRRAASRTGGLPQMSEFLGDDAGSDRLSPLDNRDEES